MPELSSDDDAGGVVVVIGGAARGVVMDSSMGHIDWSLWGGDDQLVYPGSVTGTFSGSDDPLIPIFDGYAQLGFIEARSEYDIRTEVVNGVEQTVLLQDGRASAPLTGYSSLSFSGGQTVRLAGADLNHISNVDGDRFDDVLFQSQSTGQIQFAKMVDGAFAGWGVDAGMLGSAGAFTAIASGDVNPSTTGGAEVFVQHQSDGSILFASLDSGTTTWGVVSEGLNTDFKLVAVADINGDASVDAIVQQQSTGSIFYANMAGGVFGGWNVVNVGITPDFKVVGAADINGDGFADVVLQQQSTGAILWADMAADQPPLNGFVDIPIDPAGGTFHRWGIVDASVGPDWVVKAVADVNGDGFADVIIQNKIDGTALYANMANGVFAGFGIVAENTGPTWVVSGVADVDNDGYRDVILQHTTDGATTYAHMGPNGFTGWGIVANNISSDLHVV